MRETESFLGTRAQVIVDALDRIYCDVATQQAVWKEASPFHCPQGCGSCCADFEPDVLESEALYLAAWMLYHQSERAEDILTGSFRLVGSTDGVSGFGCIFFDPAAPLHCTVYEGRCLICRLFGYTGDRGKNGRPRWKPCKFLPLVAEDAGEDRHRQYDEGELLARFGTIPLAMSDVTAQVLALSPDGANERTPLRDALPAAIAKIRMLQRFSLMPSEPDVPDPNPESPMPRAS